MTYYPTAEQKFKAQATIIMLYATKPQLHLDIWNDPLFRLIKSGRIFLASFCPKPPA